MAAAICGGYRISRANLWSLGSFWPAPEAGCACFAPDVSVIRCGEAKGVDAKSPRDFPRAHAPVSAVLCPLWRDDEDLIHGGCSRSNRKPTRQQRRFEANRSRRCSPQHVTSGKEESEGEGSVRRRSGRSNAIRLLG